MRAALTLAILLSLTSHALSEGRFEHHVVAGRAVRVYLPRAYKPGSRMPVVVAQDAQNLFGGGPFGSWDLHQALEGLVAKGRARPAVILASDHAGEHRIADYDGSRPGGGARQYNDWVRNHLLPWARARYGVSTSLRDVVGIGSSMGAHPPLDDLIEEPGKPQTYGAWAPMSPALRILGGRLQQRLELAPTLRRGRLFLMSGDTGKDGEDDDVGETERLRDHLLNARGWVHGRDLIHWRARGRDHTEATWRDFAPMALEATLGR